MKHLAIKILSTVVLFLIISNLIIPVTSLATNVIVDTKERSGRNDDVQFDATVNGEHNAKIEINNNSNLEIIVKNSDLGYIKNIEIDTNECNFDFDNTNVEELNEKQKEENNKIEASEQNKKEYPIKSIGDNKIELNEISKSEVSNVKIPIKIKETEKLTKELFNKESKITMTAILIDEKGKKKEIKREVSIQLTWENKSDVYIKQEITRNIKYQQNKTILGFQIEEGLNREENPVTNKEIIIDIPKIENQEPTKVNVLNKESITFEYKEGKLFIHKQLTEENISWSSKDIFEIVLLYNTHSNEQEISLTAKSKDTLITGTTLESEEEVNRFDISNEIGYLADIKITDNQTLSKGYMLTNINAEKKLETNYISKYSINIGYADAIDRIEIDESKKEFLDSEDNALKNADNNITNKKIEIKKDEIIDILGEDGTITLRDINNEELGVLNKDNTSLDISAGKIKLETSKIYKEGILNIEVGRVINTNIDYSKEELLIFNKLKNTISVNEFKDENQIETLQDENSIALENPYSQSELLINNNNWSTVLENENIELNILLKTDNIQTALYENSEVSIDLPREVASININTINKLYDDELTIDNMRIEDNRILFNLNGIQTQYNNSESEKGIVIRMAMNIEIDKYSTTSKEVIKLKCVNNNTGDITVSEIPIDIVAPSGMILTNKIEVDGKSSIAFQNQVEDLLIDSASPAKEMIVSGTVINNLGYDTENLSIIGRIPFEGNKTIRSQELESNMSTNIASEIYVEGMENATVYYSDNLDEIIDSDEWSTSISTSTKTFRIDSNSILKDKSVINFKYKVTIPENIGYDKKCKTTFGVYYNNNSIKGNIFDLTESIPVGITTGKEPEITLDISANDTNEGYEIDDNGTVKEGEYVTLYAKVKNTGTIDANNVTLQLTLPKGMVFVEYKPSSDSDPIARYVQDISNKEKAENIETLGAGEEKVIEFPVKVSQIISSKNSNQDSVLQTIFHLNADILTNEVQKTYTLNNTEGTLNLKLASSLGKEKKTGGLFNYSIQIENANFVEKENVVINIKLPKGIEFVEMSDKYETNYDKNKNELTIYYETAKAFPDIISFKAKISDETEDRLVTQATATYLGSSREVKSNEVIFETEKTNNIIQANQSTNISKNVLDSDNLEFYVEIKNNSDESKTLQFIDTVPSALKVNNYFLEIDGQIIEQAKTNYIKTPFELEKGKMAKVKIETTPIKQTIGKKYTIENSPEILMNETGIKVNSVSIDINGTTPESNSMVNQQEDVEEADIIYTEGTNRISGIAWIDENKNGKIDIGERRIENQEFTIYDTASNSILKDEQGNIVKASTDNNGEYTFINLKPGKYNLITTYNNREYEPTNYKGQGLGEEENSDFTLTKYENNEVLATDTIDLTNTSAYNVNLGLVNKDIFDLKLEQEISKITITDSNNNIKEYKYDKYSEKRKIEVNLKELQKAKALIEYTIRITNEGNQPGYAKTIVDYLPEGMEFSSDINPDWYLKNDGNLYNSTLMDTIIEPGETKEIKLVAIKQLKENTLGNTRNTAEIYNTYNQKGLKTIDAKAGNKVDGEKDMSSTDAIIIKTSQVKVLLVIGLSVLIVVLLIMGVWYITKKLMNKMYKTEKIEGLD